MPASVRIIRILNDTYTVETEIEGEDTEQLLNELKKSNFGLRIMTLLEDMLPEVKPKKTIYQIKEEFEKKYKEKIDQKIIDSVSLGEKEDKEILIVWINRETYLPTEFEGVSVEVKKTPTYEENEKKAEEERRKEAAMKSEQSSGGPVNRASNNSGTTYNGSTYTVYTFTFSGGYT